MTQKTSYTFKLNDIEQAALISIISGDNYEPVTIPHTTIAVRAEHCSVNLYKSGKCLIQGKGAEDFITFTMEPYVLKRIAIGYDEVLNPDAGKPHMGVDESGKGDFFGPIVIAAAYIDQELLTTMVKMGVKDSKAISSDDKALGMGRELRRLLGTRYSVVKIGPAAYNRLYLKMRNVNTLLAWAHARAIENLLEKVPNCPKAISDQFGKKELIEKSLMKNGKNIELIQMPRAESDTAVAAASIIAREQFLLSLKSMTEKYKVKIPKGASAHVREIAVELVKKNDPKILLETSKCHFRTTDQVLTEAGSSREALGPEGKAVSRPLTGRSFHRKKTK